MLPLAIGGAGGLGGFIAGYMYNYPTDIDTKQQPGEITISESELKSLTLQSPHKELKEELVNFKLDNLKKTIIGPRVPTSDELLLSEMRKKIINRRASIAC